MFTKLVGICDEVLVLDRGRKAALGPPSQLFEQSSDSKLVLCGYKPQSLTVFQPSVRLPSFSRNPSPLALSSGIDATVLLPIISPDRKGNPSTKELNTMLKRNAVSLALLSLLIAPTLAANYAEDRENRLASAENARRFLSGINSIVPDLSPNKKMFVGEEPGRIRERADSVEERFRLLAEFSQSTEAQTALLKQFCADGLQAVATIQNSKSEEEELMGWLEFLRVATESPHVGRAIESLARRKVIPHSALMQLYHFGEPRTGEEFIRPATGVATLATQDMLIPLYRRVLERK